MAKVIYDPAPIDWGKDFTPAFYLIYNPQNGGNSRPIAWGYTQCQLEVWCFCYDPSNDAENPDLWCDDDDEWEADETDYDELDF